ncbi:hypothetical protein ACQEU8_00685 [Streptomyces sp. CA-250714]|uniref:hypothetical protein n=1 Tax=Streptomyces sp. CA-250714 TaxID=3240060 RepID=UPI003D8CCBBA
MPSPDFLQLTEDDSVKWHAFRGIDLAALESTLSVGLPRSFQNQQGRWNISLSGSPGESFRSGREFQSFLTYTMNPSCLAVAVRTTNARHEPREFQDEYHSISPIEPSQVVGVTAHDGTIDSRLSDVNPNFETMHPHRCLDYLQRNTAWTARVCGQTVADELTQRLQPYRQKTEAGIDLNYAETAAVQKVFLGAYASQLRNIIGREPTVSDAVSDVMQRSGRVIPVLSWDNQTLQSLQRKNNQIAAAHSVSRAANTFTPSFGEIMRDHKLPPIPANRDHIRNLARNLFRGRASGRGGTR